MLHKYDCLRANKAMAAWGVEARVPFLSCGVLDVAMAVDPERKRVRPGGIEKELLRSAFAGVLPDETLWRQKEQFSDGVGYSWIDSLKAYAQREVGDDDLARAQWRFPYNTPRTKEATPIGSSLPATTRARRRSAAFRAATGGARSTPAAIAWDPAFAALPDPSGRAVRDVHRQGLAPAAAPAG
jgi:asparagine synthase (glutamine-hydrolysing)